MLASARIAQALQLNTALAVASAALHDLGKAHPYFQKKIYGEKIEQQDEIIHRHELSSLAFLPLFPKEDWDMLIEMVVAHHKSIYNDAKERGILDLAKSRAWIANHLDPWEEWSAGALGILEELVRMGEIALPVRPIEREEAEKALNYALSYCKKRNQDADWSEYRGLLMAGDHMASALQHSTEEKTKGLFEAPDLSRFNRGEHPLYPLTFRRADDPRPHTLVVASTGAGKTDFLFRRCKGRVFYTLPFQASINAMFDRIQAALPNTPHLRFRHAMSKIVEGRGIEEKLLQDKVGASVKVLTPHQLAAMAFGTPGFESVMLDVRGCDIILDEIHTYSDQAQAMVLAIVEVLLMLECRIHIGTATMPTRLYDELLKRLGGKEKVYEVSLTEAELEDMNRHCVYKISRAEVEGDALPEACYPILEKALAEGEKVLVICNTVNRAQQVFEDLSERFENQVPETRRMLIHSRFRRTDRIERERQLKEEMNALPGACLVVSTQVVEVSLDISFDRMITEAAPLDALIQRFGRINRVRKPKGERALKPVHVLEPEAKTLPYQKEIVQRSFEALPEDGKVLEEKEVQRMLDAVYPDLVISSISSHYIWKDGELETLSSLNHNSKSVLVEALDIESATAILECDREKYLSADVTWHE